MAESVRPADGDQSRGRTPSEVVTALAAAGLELPSVNPPLAAYVPAVRIGDLVHVAGQLPMRDGVVAVTGVVGSGGLSVPQGQSAAALCALGAIAAGVGQVGAGEVVRAVKVNVFVSVQEGFADLPEVANGASEVFGAAFGLPHARSAVGVRALPRGAAVEVDAVLAVAPSGRRP
ncbi:MAG: RidA family protein [Candidatus Nanopelagicales bacterium]